MSSVRWLLCSSLLTVLACGPTSPGDDDDSGDDDVASIDAPANAGPDAQTGGPNISCDPGSTPTAEVCDSRDNDCNGVVDDGLYMPNPAACGVLRCYLGDWIEVSGDDVGSVDELCNNHDDDCDGQTDEGLGRPDPTNSCRHQSCVGGAWVDDTPGGGDDVSDECDGFDNDCDGSTDEDFEPAPCFATCGGLPTLGFEECSGGDVVCEPADLPISLEICNNADDDCDDRVDEGVAPQPCPCGSGDETCTGGTYSGCSTGCVVGTLRWCDDPMYCHWGQQPCEADSDGVGRWGTCVETPTRPTGCDSTIYSPDCCVSAGECCQDAFDSWESVGDCSAQCIE